MALPYATENQLKLLEQKTKAELDKKTANVNLTADTLEDMNALITKGGVTEGQLCYCKADKKLYVLKDNVWSEVGGGGGIPVVEGTFSETTEEGAQFTVNIPQAQSGVFILSLHDISSYFIIGSFVGEYIGNFISINEDNPDEFIMNYFSGRGTTISLYTKNLLNGGGGNIVTIEVTSMPDTQTTIDVSAITNDTQFVNIKETSTNKNYLLYRVGSDFASCFSNELAQGKIVAYYYIDVQQKQLYYFISSVGKLGKIFGNHDIQVPAVGSSNILPCTTADNGKVLSVVNGEAQWASAGGGSTRLYQHNIVLIENSNSEYLYIKHISSKQSEVTNIADLNTLLGTGTYTFGCSGEVKINNTWYNAVAIYWDESYDKSLVMYNMPSEGEKTASLTIYTSVTDTVTPI